MNIITSQWASLALLAALAFSVIIDDQPVYSQRPANLFSMCKFGSYAENLTHGYDLVIGRELFTAIGAMRSEGVSSANCRIRSGNSDYKYKTLRLAFGMEDENLRPYRCTKPITVNVYLDGNLEDSRSLLPSEKALFLMDVSRTSSVSIEVPPNSCNNYGYVYFTQAILEPISASPGRRY